MSMYLLEGSSHCSCNLACECTHVYWLVWVGVCAFLCVKWHRQSPLEYAPGLRRWHAVLLGVCWCELVGVRWSANGGRAADGGRRLHSRRRRPPSAARARKEYAPATVSRPSSTPPPWFRGDPSKSDDLSTQNPRVQKRAPLPPEPSRVRPRHGFAATLPKVTTLARKIHGSKSARRYRQSPLEHVPATVSRPSGRAVLLGVRWLV